VRDHARPLRAAEIRAARLCLAGAALAVGMLLAGCVEEKPVPTPGPFGAYIKSVPHRAARPVSRPPGQAKTPPEAGPSEAAGSPEQAGQAPGEQATEAPPPQPEQTALAVPSSTDLLGLDPQHTRELLGPAAQTNTQSPATVWHYKSGRCELDLSFYMEMRSGQMRTLHYNFKGDADSPEQRQACLRSIIEENRKPEHS